MELGCGGALAKHVAEGDDVFVYVATQSGYAKYNDIQIRSSKVAAQEGEAAMSLMGAKLFKGNFTTLEVEFVEKLNVDILKIVEENNIDQAYIHWFGDIHHDHASVSKASLHSCRHVKRILMYRSNWYHSSLDFKGNFYIDISNYLNIKKEIILMHKSELVRTREKWIEFWENEAVNCGLRIGVKYAEVYEVVKWIQS